MFSFIHAADLHIDSPMVGLERREHAPIEALRGATRGALENLVALAIEERVAFVVIAGDLYDGKWLHIGTGLFVRRMMGELKKAGIRVLLIRGNHDAESLITSSLSLPDNVHVFPSEAAATVRLDDLRVAIHGWSFATRSVRENLVPRYPSREEGWFNLGVLHTSLNGREGHDPYSPCTEQDLLNKEYDYWALGHVHIPEVVREQGSWIVYAGNSQGRSVRETGPRGCQLVRVDDALRVKSVEHRPLDVIRWAHERVDLRGVEEAEEVGERVQDAVRRAAGDRGDRLLALRLTLEGMTPLHDLLHRDREAWDRDIRAWAEDCCPRVWLEKVKRKTETVYDVAERAERDEVTRLVLESLQTLSLDLEKLPGEIATLISTSPSPVKGMLEDALGDANRAALLEEVRSVILATLSGRGSDQR